MSWSRHDAAIGASVDCGAWCPERRIAEDGRISDRYPLTELKSGDYPQRTLKNVADSEGQSLYASASQLVVLS